MVVVRAVLARSPWLPLVPPIAGERAGQRALGRRCSQSCLVHRTLNCQRAPLEREVYASTARHDVAPLGVTLDARQDAEPARWCQRHEVEVGDARLRRARCACRVGHDAVDGDALAARLPQSTRHELDREAHEEVGQRLVVGCPLPRDVPPALAQLDE